MKKNFFLIVFALLIFAQFAYAGVTNPLPSELNLKKGETGRFKFQIQAAASDPELTCKASFKETPSIAIRFDEDSAVVAPGTIKEMYGSVTVPSDSPYTTYSNSFCVSCSPSTSTAGASVQIVTCDLPVKVNVVEQRTRENMYISPEPLGLAAIMLGIVIILLLVWIIWLLYNLRNKTKKPASKSKR